MNISGIISGAVLLLGGIALIIGGLFTSEIGGMVVMCILGVIFAFTGGYILLYSEREDKIEPIIARNKKARSVGKR